MDVTKLHKFIRFGAMDVSKPCEYIGHDVPFNFSRFSTCFIG
jgi:hypothetical protein